jgi:hypothetical protein
MSYGNFNNFSVNVELCVAALLAMYRIDLGGGGDSSKGRNFMTVDMLLSDDESHNDRMLRAELRSNDDMQRLQLERRIHSPKVADEGAGTICSANLSTNRRHVFA